MLLNVRSLTIVLIINLIAYYTITNNIMFSTFHSMINVVLLGLIKHSQHAYLQTLKVTSEVPRHDFLHPAAPVGNKNASGFRKHAQTPHDINHEANRVCKICRGLSERRYKTVSIYVAHDDRDSQREQNPRNGPNVFQMIFFVGRG